MALSWVRSFAGVLPHGSALPAEEWLRRHRAILRFVIISAAVVGIIAALQGKDEWHALPECAIPVMMALLAWKLRVSKRIRASLASAALMVIAALVVHIFGTIEAHFLFFIMVPVVALYEDWAPFATATALVFAHHGVAAVSDAGSVYNHSAAIEEPLLWTLIHSVLFLGICVTSVVHWNIHEKARAGERALVERLDQMAHHDPLTGLPNRKLLNDRLAQAVRAAGRNEGPVGLLIVDVDGFKQINDLYGHAAGDELLNAVARRLSQCTRTGDTVARLGGDEFALVLPGTGHTSAAQVAQRVIDALAEPSLAGGTLVTVGASVGVAVGSAGEQPEDLMRRADAALYAAKRSGRGRYVTYSAGLNMPERNEVPLHSGEAREPRVS